MKSSKPSKQESRQAVVQAGKLGFYPFNSLSLSALKHHDIFCILDTTSAEENAEQPIWKKKSEWTVGKKTFDLEGKVFPGFTDAFYRGKLPELVVVTCPMLDIPQFLETLMAFLEKLCVLGFFNDPELDEIAALDQYVPQFVLASYGIVFNVVQDKLQQFTQNLSGMSNHQKDRLLQKMSRGVFVSPHYILNETFAVSAKPLDMLLAGYKSKYTIRMKELFDGYHIASELNQNGEVGIIEYELNLAYQHITGQILPQVGGKAKSLEKKLGTLMDNLAQQMGVLPGLVTTKRQYLDSSESKNPPSMLDLAILHQIARYADKTDITELSEIAEELLEPLEDKIKQANAVKSS